MIVSFIAVGLLIGPSGLGLISSSASIDILAELGIALLLFLVGLYFFIKHLASTPFRETLVTRLSSLRDFLLLFFFIAMGITLGHLDNQALGVTTLVGLITIALSVYMITYSQKLFDVFGRYLGVFERKNPFREIKAELEKQETEQTSYDVIIFGLGRFGSALANYSLNLLFGDALDLEFIQSLPLHKTQWVISAVPEHEFGLSHNEPRPILIDALKDLNFQGKIAVSTHFENEKAALLKRGADQVFIPFQDAACKAAEVLYRD